MGTNKSSQPRSTATSWTTYDRYLPHIATGSSTMSKRPTLRPDEPCYIARGDGCRVWDIDGNEYIDFRNALGPITLGYRFPAVDEAIRQQLDKGVVFGHPTTLEGEVAERLVEVIPCAEKVRYLKTGGEAIAAAIKVARAATGRDIILHCGYNGWLNSLAAGGRALPGRVQDAPLGVPAAVSALHRAVPWGDLAPWEAAFTEHNGHIAAAIVAMDYFEADLARNFLPQVRALTAQHGTLLIIDEIVTGFRIAIGGLHEFCNVDVDMAVFSKGMANGMPLSALVGNGELLDVIERAPISSTFAGEALSLAAAKASIETYRTGEVVPHLAARGREFVDGANRVFASHGVPLRYSGMPACPFLHPTQGDPRNAGAPAIDSFLRAAYRNGLSLYLVSYPNFSHSEADIAEALERLDAAVREVAAG